MAYLLRALYQRRKGRDLFDIWYALDAGRVTPSALLACFDCYLAEEGRTVTRAQFEENLSAKRTQPDFRDDAQPLLRPGLDWDVDVAVEGVLDELVARLPGAPWKGEGEE